jgi:ribulose kinase
MPLKKYSEYVNEELSGLTVVPKHIGDLSPEADMAMGQLKTIIDHSSELINIVANFNDLPAWVQAKITTATDYIEKVHSYLNSKYELKDLNPK